MHAESLLPLLGQFLLGAVFVFAGLRNIAGFDALAGILAARGAPLPRGLLATGIALQIVAGALVILGLWPALAAAALIAFLVAATVLFHNFWDHSGLDRSNRINGAASNVALAGGFLLVIAMAQ